MNAVDRHFWVCSCRLFKIAVWPLANSIASSHDSNVYAVTVMSETDSRAVVTISNY